MTPELAGSIGSTFAMTKSTPHIRLPQRADAVGKERLLESIDPPRPTTDPRTVSQNLVKQPSRAKKEENVTIAELDQGPLIA
jgi:hypothetical protein